MIKKILIILFSACLLLGICGCKDEEPTEEITRGDGIFSEFTAVDFDGNIVDSSVFDGYKVTMVNVWATWCDPCKKELPALAELNEEYKDEGFQVIGIAYDTADKNYNKVQSSYNAAINIIEQTGANFRHLIPSKSLKDFLDPIQAVPVTVFVDEDGYQIGRTYTGSKSKADWGKIIELNLDFINISN